MLRSTDLMALPAVDCDVTDDSDSIFPSCLAVSLCWKCLIYILTYKVFQCFMSHIAKKDYRFLFTLTLFQFLRPFSYTV